MKFTIITLFPDFLQSLCDYSIIGRAIKNKKISLKTINLRDFGLGNYKQVDDKPYGGGAGMLFRVDVVSSVIKEARQKALKKNRVVLLCPSGERFSHQKAVSLSKYDEIIFVCGHYEGFDQRIHDYVDEKISIGDFVISGGELAAMTIIDAVSRQIDGVLGNPDSLEEESFKNSGSSEKDVATEYPQYTRPEEFEGKKVPEVLLSGDPKKIRKWQETQER
ncbi:MAG: tRNA (guanine-N(1)-)-methyltransferase [candidate division WS2 bacterium ADurb.Bin280]|uniref:tRNA (guanine-N(1)-)-methyltransferase n=1 Tax=candidate division WS2 bacterium ADurb.Bin280 TaxID=1852829 RepID=A0A1V5SGH7_9BACT|nr:MAG: tRNA (guanine-N(1)-)-methyltransferase [candidate division WS2 bacterium ADurb.Bin280]